MSYAKLKQRAQQRFIDWLDKRQPATPSLALTQGVIYILPSRFGWWFSFLIILLYLLGTNYQNNLILLASFVLMSVLLSTMVLAFLNVHRLRLTVTDDAVTYAPLPAALTLKITANLCQMLQIRLKGQRHVQLLEYVAGTDAFTLMIPALDRGCYSLPRLVLKSDYPLGLFTTWSYPALQTQIWVYPEPVAKYTDTEQTLPQATNTPPTTQNELQPTDPTLLRAYQQGDSPKHILWKRLPAAPQQPVVRQRGAPLQSLPEWVHVPLLQGPALEHALSHACQQLLDLEAQGRHYGLQTATAQIAPASGQLHLTRCLQELALC
ncbi:DUF58 domain-containing protein [Alishewanella tabrizica]|uniref:DUF58 domain-containing protein n=1 Tax=Alishewanella tabrizica TaxID=671278 RepID=A0ABQ2WIB3_9ALTE|nr:hypothetical protein [Alishewanella tabrizica]GGW57980.1 hypothetical protein GCM10008111_12680 [Alishewanella tabrizica]